MISLRTLFKSKNYRALVRMDIVAAVIQWAMQPYWYIKGKLIGRRLKKEYPNRWERYVKAKEIVNEADSKTRRTENWVALNSELLMFNEVLLVRIAHVTGQTKRPLTDEEVKAVYEGLEEYRKDILELIKTICDDGGTGLENLREIVANVKAEDFNQLEDLDPHIDLLEAALDKVSYC